MAQMLFLMQHQKSGFEIHSFCYLPPFGVQCRFLSPDRYTDTGLLELEVQFVGIGKFADTKKNCPPP